jgi:site-specific recombinase XerD
MKTTQMQPDFPGLLQGFFCQHMMAERGLSAQTVASYRDTFRLLLRFAQERLGIAPSKLTLADLDAKLILAFLDHLEKVRGVSIRTRNTRLAAVRSFMRYAAGRVPPCLGVVRSVLAVPTKRFDRSAVEFLSRQEVEAIINAPNLQLWSGRRDHCLLATLYNTGARVSEIAGIKVVDVRLDQTSAVHLRGKGRKHRTIPLWKRTARAIKRWLNEVDPALSSPLFPNRFGQIMTRSGVEKRLQLAVRKATNNVV